MVDYEHSRCSECHHRDWVHYMEKGFRKCMGEAMPCMCIKEYYQSDSE